jgi:hypothetical protein
VTQLVFFDNAGESCRQHDDRQANQADFGPVESQGDDQENDDQRLGYQSCRLGLGSLLIFQTIVFFEDATGGHWHLGSVTEQLQPLHGYASQHTNDKNRNAHGRHADEKLTEFPAGKFTNQ